MNYIKNYSNFLAGFLKPEKKIKIVFDCSNGTTGLVLKELFPVSDVEAILINDKPDGNFPAHGPNPMAEGALEDLKKAVLKEKADLGVAFDADGDRAFFVDNRGREVISDAAIAILAQNFPGPVVLTINVGMMARDLLKETKKEILDSRVGHYFIKKLIREKKIDFAAERSGHYYFKEFFYCDSAIFSAIQIANSISRLNKSLSEWIDELPEYHRSGELNFEVKEKETTIKKVEEYYKREAKDTSNLDGLTMNFGDWWLNLRASNTEDLLRLNLEAKDKKIFKERLQEIKGLVISK